jgi:hypothetical protein
MSQTEHHQGAVNFDAGLVKVDAQLAAQAADAAPEKPIATIGGISAATPVPVVVVDPLDAEIAQELKFLNAPSINTITVLPFVTLSYGTPYMKGLKELKSVTLEVTPGTEETFNFHNPFLKANGAKNLSEGVLRRVFGKIVNIVRAAQNREVSYIGKPVDLQPIVQQVAEGLVRDILRKFPLSQDETLLELVVDGTDFDLKFGDLFTLKTWTVVALDEETSVVNSVINLNLVINAAALYDSPEPHKFIIRAISFVRGILEKMGEEVLNPYVGVAISSDSLQEPENRELLDILLSPEEGFALVSRNSVSLGKEPWISPKDADSLFVNGTDILLFSHVFADEDEGDEEEEAAGEEDDNE